MSPAADDADTNKKALDLLWKIEGVLNSIDFILVRDATSSFPEHLWSLPLQQARFPDFRLERVASRPSQSQGPVTIIGSYAIAGTQWREPSGHFTQLPLSPSMGTCDGPTRYRNDSELKQRYY